MCLWGEERREEGRAEGRKEKEKMKEGRERGREGGMEGGKSIAYYTIKTPLVSYFTVRLVTIEL